MDRALIRTLHRVLFCVTDHFIVPVGGELFERVVAEDFDLTEAECVVFLQQICSGAEYLHSRSVIHLDLKPENIVCCQKNSSDVKIIDFGLAKDVKEGEVIKVIKSVHEQ